MFQTLSGLAPRESLHSLGRFGRLPIYSPCVLIFCFSPLSTFTLICFDINYWLDVKISHENWNFFHPAVCSLLDWAIVCPSHSEFGQFGHHRADTFVDPHGEPCVNLRTFPISSSVTSRVSREDDVRYLTFCSCFWIGVMFWCSNLCVPLWDSPAAASEIDSLMDLKLWTVVVGVGVLGV